MVPSRTSLVATSLSYVDSAGRAPLAGGTGVCIECAWEVANLGEGDIRVSFFVRTAPAALLALVSPRADVCRGRFHGTAALVVPSCAAARISALVRAPAEGAYTVRVAAVTRAETLERADTVVVSTSPRHVDQPVGEVAHQRGEAAIAAPPGLVPLLPGGSRARHSAGGVAPALLPRNNHLHLRAPSVSVVPDRSVSGWIGNV
jgi:hypothetical protein